MKQNKPVVRLARALKVLITAALLCNIGLLLLVPAMARWKYIDGWMYQELDVYKRQEHYSDQRLREQFPNMRLVS